MKHSQSLNVRSSLLSMKQPKISNHSSARSSDAAAETRSAISKMMRLSLSRSTRNSTSRRKSMGHVISRSSQFSAPRKSDMMTLPDQSTLTTNHRGVNTRPRSSSLLQKRKVPSLLTNHQLHNSNDSYLSVQSPSLMTMSPSTSFQPPFVNERGSFILQQHSQRHSMAEIRKPSLSDRATDSGLSRMSRLSVNSF